MGFELYQIVGTIRNYTIFNGSLTWNLCGWFDSLKFNTTNYNRKSINVFSNKFETLYKKWKIYLFMNF
jgi:hypothetical protein